MTSGAPDRTARYRDFWRYYIGEHRRLANQRLHFVGTTIGIALIAAAIITLNPWYLLGIPVAAYGPAWLGHFFVEGNQPATFRNPVYSLIADFHMYGLMWAGRMGREVGKHAPGSAPAAGG